MEEGVLLYQNLMCLFLKNASSQRRSRRRKEEGGGGYEGAEVVY